MKKKERKFFALLSCGRLHGSSLGRHVSRHLSMASSLYSSVGGTCVGVDIWRSIAGSLFAVWLSCSAWLERERRRGRGDRPLIEPSLVFLVDTPDRKTEREREVSRCGALADVLWVKLWVVISFSF